MKDKMLLHYLYECLKGGNIWSTITAYSNLKYYISNGNPHRTSEPNVADL